MTNKEFMKKTYLLLAVTMGIALVSCSDDVTGIVASPAPAEESAAIMFGNVANAVTRADRATSAELLNNEIVFFGDKKTAANATTTIFDNYRLQFTQGSAGKTETNKTGWEYVGLTSLKNAAQDVKYWDYTSKQYNFVAAAGLANGETIAGTTDGMKINVADANAMSGIYIADRITVEPKDYNKTVQFQFRRLGARMRIGFYETVPGYAIKDLIFYYVGAPSGSRTLGVGGAFPKSGKYNVTYGDDNKATVKFNGGSNVMAWSGQFGTLDYTYAESKVDDDSTPYIDRNGKATATPDKVFLAGSSATPTFAKGTYTIDGVANTYSDYKPILPNENNTLKMQLRVDYTLVALDGSGDEIKVRDAYVSVPVEYLQWKPNYAYTYIFKISDRSNGYTGRNDGAVDPDTGGRKPDPDNGGGDNDPEQDPDDPGNVIPPYIPNPDDPNAVIPDPDDPDKVIPNPDVPLVPNPDYPKGPEGDQHDPSNPVPTPKDPYNPDKPDPDDPAGLYPITFDAVVEDPIENTQETVTTVTTPSITAMSSTSKVTVNNEYKVDETITLSVQDGVTPDAWQYLSSTTEISEKKAAELYGDDDSKWTSLGTEAKATLTPRAKGYYVVRVKAGTAYGYTVIKVV